MTRVLVSAAAAALIASTAGAADLPSYEAYGTPPAPQGVNWSGFYIGSQLGWAWGNGDAEFDNGAPSLNYDPNGFVIGGHAGYNYQWGSLVAGVEGDIEWADVDGGSDSSGAGITSSGSIEMNWDASIRARIGGAFQRALLYTTAGAAIGGFDVDGGPVGASTSSFSSTEWGWTAGAGVEYAIMPNITTRVEYRYTDFGKVEGSVAPAFAGTDESVDFSTQTVRAGLSYKF
jgi:outer membrane immunogenic protein